MKKPRKRLNLVKGSFNDEQPLNTQIWQYPLPTKDMYDSNKIDWRTIMDEPAMWKEATPEEAKAAKIAYEKWRTGNKSPL